MGWPDHFDNNYRQRFGGEVSTYRLHPIKESKGAIGSVAALCSALDLSAAQLADALALPMEVRYTRKVIPKKDGTVVV